MPNTACNACRKRKVRCDGLPDCQQCQRHGLSCVYGSRTHARSSRLGSMRGGVIQSLSESSSTEGAPLSLNAPQDDDGFFDSLLGPYNTLVYPLMPVVTAAELQHHIRNRHSGGDSATLVYAVAAVVAVQSRMTQQHFVPDTDTEIYTWLDLAFKNRMSISPWSPPTLDRFLALLFVQVCFTAMHRAALAFFYLREAISTAQLLRLDSCDTTEIIGTSPTDTDVDTSQQAQELARRQRAYWVCYIHERVLAIHCKYPICMDPLPSLPLLDPLLSGPVERGWNYLIRAFETVDKEFIKFWMTDAQGITREWIEEKYRHLTDESWLSDIQDLPMARRADITITRQWLTTLLWQMAMPRIWLSSSSEVASSALSLVLPLRLSSELRTFLNSASPAELSTPDDMVHKLFETTTSIADVILQLPPTHDPEERRLRIRDFMFAASFLLRLPAISNFQVSVLEAKVAEIQGAYHCDDVHGRRSHNISRCVVGEPGQ